MSTVAANAVHDRLAIEVAPVERVLYWGSRIVIAQFSCRPDHPHFFGTGPIQTPVFGFPRKSASLAVNDGKPFLADPTVAVLLNRGDHYRRSVVADEGDRSDLIGIDEELLASVIASVQPAALDRVGSARFPTASAPVNPAAYRDIHVLVARLKSGYAPSELEVEECVLGALAAVLRGSGHEQGMTRGTASGKAISVVREARAYLLTHVEQSCSLKELAKAVNVSPFHLAHTFRNETGTTLHQYFLQLKLRSSLDLLPNAHGDLTGVAMKLGFSSHSHFTDMFRRAFGTPPSSFSNAVPRA
jgi:AraC-like DNA-binding protein